MKQLTAALLLVAGLCWGHEAAAQVYNQIDDNGNISQFDESTGNGTSQNFNKHSKDSTKTSKQIPKGLKVWHIDRRFGDITPATPDTMPHLFPNTLLNTGLYGEYNTTGNNYTARESRIVIDRPLKSQFIFTDPYSFIMQRPDELLFTNTLSPLTNITYDNCGNKTNGEDHLRARFAVNAGKRLGLGFDLNYAYARGYYANQNVSHFGATLYGSYQGDRYQANMVFSTWHQKAAENGGITDDNYITHPETFDDSYATNEIPTVLSENWNRNDNIHLLFNHRYNFGFWRKVKMTDEEIKARRFAEASKKDNAGNDRRDDGKTTTGTGADRKGKGRPEDSQPKGRPDNARIAGDEPGMEQKRTAGDSTRVKVNDANRDSLLAARNRQDSIDATMKNEYVPVTSFIHTLDVNSYDRIYQAYATPDNYYADTFYRQTAGLNDPGDSIYDQTKYLSVKNTLAIALLEGFNKYAKAGLKVFAAHEYRRFRMPAIATAGTTAAESLAQLATWNEHNVSVGAQLIKTQGKTLHYNLAAETWLVGEDFGQLNVDFSTDVNFRLFGDTVTLAAKAYFYRLHPTFYERQYHSKHLWWDNGDLSNETRLRAEGIFAYRKTRTSLRVAVEEIQNLTYFTTAYNYATDGRTGLTAGVAQCATNINLLTAQLRQDFTFGPLNWENVVTYQSSSMKSVLPVPMLNVFTNLYFKFRLVRQLNVELGADAWYFTKYDAPDFVPQINQFAIQQTEASKVKLGGYPIVDAYVNMHLKSARFFVSYTHLNSGSGSRMYFLAPHYPQNAKTLRFGISWNFFN